MQHPEYLYHYTTLDFVPKILEDGFLMLTPSNLVKPTRYWKERRDDGNYDIVSDSDDRGKIAIGMAAGGVRAVNKMTAKFVIPWNDKYQWWLDWQKKNRMKKSQYRIFTSHGEHYGSWYVCEEQIPMSDVEEIVNNLTGEVIWRREGGGE